jgi:hypothetical protein
LIKSDPAAGRFEAPLPPTTSPMTLSVLIAATTFPAGLTGRVEIQPV